MGGIRLTEEHLTGHTLHLEEGRGMTMLGDSTDHALIIGLKYVIIAYYQ